MASNCVAYQWTFAREVIKGDVGIEHTALSLTLTIRSSRTVIAGHILFSVDCNHDGCLFRPMEKVYFAERLETKKEVYSNEAERYSVGAEVDQDWNNALEEKISKTMEKRISAHGSGALSRHIRRDRHIIRLRHEKRSFVQIPPPCLRLKERSRTVRTNSRRYTTDEWHFLRNFAPKL